MTNWKEDQATRKAELKELAKEIKALKPIFKESQRDVSRNLDNYNVEENARTKRTMMYSPAVLGMVKDLHTKSLLKMWDHQTKLGELQRRYRFNHIIYCLYNGTPIDKIEPTHDETHYNWLVIKDAPEYRAAQNAQIDWEAKQMVAEEDRLKDPNYEKGLFFEQAVI